MLHSLRSQFMKGAYGIRGQIPSGKERVGMIESKLIQSSDGLSPFRRYAGNNSESKPVSAGRARHHGLPGFRLTA